MPSALPLRCPLTQKSLCRPCTRHFNITKSKKVLNAFRTAHTKYISNRVRLVRILKRLTFIFDVEMLKHLLLIVVVGSTWCTAARSKVSASPSEVTGDVDSCQLPLPIGCSCVQDRTAISVECSGAQMTSVPKHWFGSGNLVVKTLNLERNNISEVRCRIFNIREGFYTVLYLSFI